MAEFRRALRLERYDVILNLQEQVKGAVVSWFARGTRHGLDRANIREPIATIVDDVHHAVSRDLHIVDRCRGIAAAALGYSADGPPRWNFAPPSAASAMPAGPYAVAFHATSRADKAWPEDRWRALVTHFARAGFATLLPWGDERERARSESIAGGSEGAVVPPRQTLPELATLSRHAEIVVGVDTGLTHLAAALGTSTVAIFTATDPRLAGVACTGAHARDAGGNGQRSVAGGRRGPLRATAAAGAALLATRELPMARRLYTLLWWLILPLVPLKLWWRGRREPGYRLRIGERFGRYGSDAPVPARRRDLDPRGVTGRDTRGGSFARARRARAAGRDDPADAHDRDRARRRACAVRRFRAAGLASLRRALRHRCVPGALPSARRPADGNRGLAQPRRRMP